MEQMGKKTIFMFMCHTFNEGLLKEHQKIVKATKGLGETCLLFHQREEKLPSKLKKQRKYLFTDQSLAKLNYPMLRKSLVEGYCHFPLLQFFLDHPDYDFYWLIEYDVRFSGDWRKFFKYFSRSKADFLACDIRSYADQPKWPWWELKHPSENIPLQQRYASFEPIYRISNRGLKLIHDSLRDGWRGHQEVILPTLLYHHGYLLRDFGGDGRFVRPKDINRFYYKNTTVRWRPPFKKIGKNDQKLYHPIKSC
jgi:hypothetical protein